MKASERFKTVVENIIPSAAKIENKHGIFFVWSPGINRGNFDINNLDQFNCVCVSYIGNIASVPYKIFTVTNERGFLETEDKSFDYHEFWELEQSLKISFFKLREDNDDEYIPF